MHFKMYKNRENILVIFYVFRKSLAEKRFYNFLVKNNECVN